MPNKNMKTNDKFLKELEDKGILYKPLEEYKGCDKRILWLCDKHDNHKFYARPNSVLDGHGCPYCSGHKVLTGYNDLWTTHKNIAKCLKDDSVGYIKSYGSTYKTDWICPDCGAIIKNKSICGVVFSGLYCDNCGKNISYPERVMCSFLNQLNVDYIRDKTTSWSHRKRYDFIIEDMSIIIECHGAQHYLDKKCFNVNNLKKIQENDNYKMNLALENGISTYVQLDCRESDFEYIKTSIINSELSDIFDLNDFDWNLCEKNICMINVNYYNDILNLVKSGIDAPSEISEILHIKRETVIRYLIKMADVGICDYNHDASISNHYKKLKQLLSKRVVCIETGRVFESITDAGNWANVNRAAISACCRGKTKTSMGYHWEYYYE